MQLLSNTNIDFVGKRKITLVLSTVIILAGIASLLIKGGPNLSIDFKGGVTEQVRITPAVDIGQVRDALAATTLNVQGVQEFGTPEEILVLLEVESEEDVEPQGLNDDTPTVTKTLQEAFPSNEVIFRSRGKVGPKIGDELRTGAVNSVFVALMLIVGYITLRFVFNFGLGAVAALVHDVMITLGIFSLLDKEISLTILAAFMTIIGYSLNDTIVVFDRVRENMGLRRRESYESVINKSINETLSRTVITSITTMVVAMILFLFGGPVIHDFAFALVIGVIVGTYSSIFVASPVLIAWYRWRSSDRKRRGGPAPESSSQKATVA